MTTVMGIDPSLTGTGVATAGGQLLTVKTVAGQERRLTTIRQAIYKYCWANADQPADLAIIEDLPAHAQGAGLTGLAHGAVRIALEEADVPYMLIPPATLKVYATGKGIATKADMRMALYQRAGLDVRDDNQADAAWLRYLGLDLVGQPGLHLPVTHRRALAKLTLPSSFMQAQGA